MAIVQTLSLVSTRVLLQQAAAAAKYDPADAGPESVARALREYLGDRGDGLNKAIAQTRDHAWDSLDFALREVGFFGRVFAGGARKAFRRRLHDLLAGARPTEDYPDLGRAFRERCVNDLRSALRSQLAVGEPVCDSRLADEVARILTAGQLVRLYDVERRLISPALTELNQAGFRALAFLLGLRSVGGSSVLAALIEHYLSAEFRPERPIFQAALFDRLRELARAARLPEAPERERRVPDLWDERVEARRQPQHRHLSEAVVGLLQEQKLDRTELQLAHSDSIEDPTRVQRVRGLVRQFRALPPEVQQAMPALLNDLGKLLYAAGFHLQAGEIFRELPRLAPEGSLRAEPYFNAYRNALAQHDWKTALENLKLAVRCDRSLEPFPMYRYEADEILDADTNRILFRCRDKAEHREVVLEVLFTEGLGSQVRDLAREAAALSTIEHPAIVRMHAVEFADPDTQRRPFLVREHVRGRTLRQHVREHGPLSEAELLQIAIPVADALREVHVRAIYHLSLDPTDLILQQEEGKPLQVTLTDFDLLRQQRKGPSGVAADVHGFGKVCCFALFRTSNPVPALWEKRPVSPGLKELLVACTQEDPGRRPRDFGEVLNRLRALKPAGKSPETVPLPVEERAGQRFGGVGVTETPPVGALAELAPEDGPPQPDVVSVLPVDVGTGPLPVQTPPPPPVPGVRLRRTLWKLILPQDHDKSQAPRRKRDAQQAPHEGPGQDLLAEMVAVPLSARRSFLIHPEPVLCTPVRCKSHFYPVPNERTTLTLQEWIDRNDGPPDWTAARRLLGVYGLRLPTVAQMRAALASGAIPKLLAPAWVRDEQLRLFLPNGQVGFPDLVKYRPGDNRYRRVLIAVSDQSRPELAAAPTEGATQPI